MRYESEIPPLCRCCGKPIAKRADQVWFGTSVSQSEDRFKGVYPHSKQEVQTLVNGTVISVRWHRFGEYSTASDRMKAGGDYIYSASVWDGVSYDDQFFCSNTCAIDLGRACAKEGRVFGAYNKAVEAHKAKR